MSFDLEGAQQEGFGVIYDRMLRYENGRMTPEEKAKHEKWLEDQRRRAQYLEQGGY